MQDMFTGIEKLVSVAFSTFVAKPVGNAKVSFLCEGHIKNCIRMIMRKGTFLLAGEMLFQDLLFINIYHKRSVYGDVIVLSALDKRCSQVVKEEKILCFKLSKGHISFSKILLTGLVLFLWGYITLS